MSALKKNKSWGVLEELNELNEEDNTFVLVEEGDVEGSNVFEEINVDHFLPVEYSDYELEDDKDWEDL